MMRTLFLLCMVLVMGATAHANNWDWSELSPDQRTVLAPMEHDWASFPPARRRTLAELARRYPSGSPEYQRIRENIRHWVALDQTERAQARTGFSKFKALSPEEQQTVVKLWQEYQKLPESSKQRLRDQARRN